MESANLVCEGGSVVSKHIVSASTRGVTPPSLLPCCACLGPRAFRSRRRLTAAPGLHQTGGQAYIDKIQMGSPVIVDEGGMLSSSGGSLVETACPLGFTSDRGARRGGAFPFATICVWSFRNLPHRKRRHCSSSSQAPETGCGYLQKQRLLATPLERSR